MNARWAPIFGLLLLSIGCDQVAKSAARQALARSEPVSLLAGAVRLEYAENQGAFLSLGAGLAPGVRFLVFGVMTAVVLAGCLLVLLRARDWPAPRLFGLCLVVGGGIGNLIDRFLHGAVVDFVSVGFGPVRTGIFNLADLAITCGALLILASPWQGEAQAPRGESS